MKKPSKGTKGGSQDPKLLLAQLASAEQKLELARKKAHAAKVGFKHARKAFKQAKKAAKQARKLAKAAVKAAKPKLPKSREKAKATHAKKPKVLAQRTTPAGNCGRLTTAHLWIHQTLFRGSRPLPPTLCSHSLANQV